MLNLKKELEVKKLISFSPSYHCFPYERKLFHCNKMAEAFTKGSMKSARGKGLLIAESPHNFAPPTCLNNCLQ